MKLVYVMTYFIKNTNNCFKTKLIKLLYLLDFEHYRLTGKSVTGLQYRALDKGPVPRNLFEKLDEPYDSELEKYFTFKKTNYLIFVTNEISPKQDFNAELFTKRELNLLSDLSNKFKNTSAKDLIEITHESNSPWEKVYNSNPYGEIDYRLVLDNRPDSISKEEVEEKEFNLKIVNDLFNK